MSTPLLNRATPLVPVRAVHLDLKGLPPTPARLLKLLDVFARANFNAVLVEWEDAFPWTVDPRFRSETAYTPQQVDAFHRRARELKLQVIPLVQSLGHMETPLRLPEYAALRELPDRSDGLNPLAPGARDLVRRMVDDVLERTGPVTHFHLGGDEHFTFGSHPDTKAYIARHGRAALYLHHVEPLLDALVARGVRPILWHDMMHDWDAASLARLKGKADLMVWSYQGHPDAAPAHYGTANVERAIAAGLTVWGASAYKGADGRGDGDVPNAPKRLANAAGWADVARRHPLAGLCATAWSRYSTARVQCDPIDGALDVLLQTGAIFHDGEPADEAALTGVLKEIGERERFSEAKAALTRLADARREAWEFILLCREQRTTERLDPRRRGSGMLDDLTRMGKDQLAAATVAADAVRKALAGSVEDVWIERYLAERLEPLKDV